MPHWCAYTCAYLSVSHPLSHLCCSFSLTLSYSFRHSCRLTCYVSILPPPPAVLGSSGSVALLASHSIASPVLRLATSFVDVSVAGSPLPSPFHSPLLLCALPSISFAILLPIVPHGPLFSLDVPFCFLLFTTSRVKPFAPLLRMAFDRLTNPQGHDIRIRIRIRHLLCVFSTTFVTSPRLCLYLALASPFACQHR